MAGGSPVSVRKGGATEFKTCLVPMNTAGSNRQEKKHSARSLDLAVYLFTILQFSSYREFIRRVITLSTLIKSCVLTIIIYYVVDFRRDLVPIYLHKRRLQMRENGPIHVQVRILGCNSL